MTTTITLTPTLALTVAGSRRLPHSSVEAVWAAIRQHTRATGTPGTVDVVDGSQTVRRWVISPKGERHQVEDPDTVTADFVLSLSPWNMSIPREDGPTTKEVSTLAVAREQAHAAAAAGKADIILQVIGTDHDTAETITPLDSSPDTKDPEDDLPLEEFLVTDDEQDPQDPKTKRRRLLVLGGSAATALLLVGCVGAGFWAATVPINTEPQSAPTPTASSSIDASASPQPLSAQAQAPAGFRTTPDWTVTGATDQASGLSWTGEHIAAVSGRTLNVVDAADGEITTTEQLPASITTGPLPLADPGTNGGVLMANDDAIYTWAERPDLVKTTIPDSDRLVVRGTTAFLVPNNRATTPPSIKVVTTNGLQEFTSPGSAASPMGPGDKPGRFLWASNAEGGSVVTAERDGKSVRQTRLIGPSQGTTIAQWIGATEDFAAVIWANDGTGSVLAIHDAKTGKVVESRDLGTTGAGAGMRIVPSTDGQQILAGSTRLDLHEGKILTRVQGISTTRTGVTAVPGAWKAVNADGRSILIPVNDPTVTAPSDRDALLGLDPDGAVIVDHRGTLARFTPEPVPTDQP